MQQQKPTRPQSKRWPTTEWYLAWRERRRSPPFTPDTMLDQIQLQINRFDGMYAGDPIHRRRDQPTTICLISSISCRTIRRLRRAQAIRPVHRSHDGGFAEQPGYPSGTIQHYQDNQAQTDFWSAFVAGAKNSSTMRSRPRPTERRIWTRRASPRSFSKSMDMSSSAPRSMLRREASSAPDFDNELLGGTLDRRYRDGPGRPSRTSSGQWRHGIGGPMRQNWLPPGLVMWRTPRTCPATMRRTAAELHARTATTAGRSDHDAHGRCQHGHLRQCRWQ